MAKVKRASKRYRVAMEKANKQFALPPDTYELMRMVKPKEKSPSPDIGVVDDIYITQADLEDYERRLQFSTRRRRVFY